MAGRIRSGMVSHVEVTRAQRFIDRHNMAVWKSNRMATERRAILSRALSISMGSGWPDRLDDPLVSTSNIGTAEWIYHGLPTASWLALKLAAGITASV